MNRLIKTGYILAIAYLIIGFVAGGIWQGELLNVGVQYLEMPPNAFSTIVFVLHKNCLMFSLPMALCAAAISCLKFEHQTLRNICRYTALILLVSTIIPFVIPFVIPGFALKGWYLLIPAAALMVSVIQSFLRLFSLAPLTYSLGTGFTAFIVIGILVMLKNPDTDLQDTYVKIAGIHGVAVIALGLIFANLVSVVSQYGKTWFKWVFTAHAVLLNIAGFFFIWPQLFAGFSGMPIGYLDYPQEFASDIRTMSIAGLFLAFLVTPAAIIFAIRVIRYRNRDADIFK